MVLAFFSERGRRRTPASTSCGSWTVRNSNGQSKTAKAPTTLRLWRTFSHSSSRLPLVSRVAHTHSAESLICQRAQSLRIDCRPESKVSSLWLECRRERGNGRRGCGSRGCRGASSGGPQIGNGAFSRVGAVRTLNAERPRLVAGSKFKRRLSSQLRPH